MRDSVLLFVFVRRLTYSLCKRPRQKGAALGESGIRSLAGVEETNKNQYLIGEKPQRRRGRQPKAPVGDSRRAGSTRARLVPPSIEGGIIFCRSVFSCRSAA